MQERVGVPTKKKDDEDDTRTTGMQEEIREMANDGDILTFDSSFECGNLDRVVMVSPTEYDLYMRPDTNVRTHH